MKVVVLSVPRRNFGGNFRVGNEGAFAIECLMGFDYSTPRECDQRSNISIVSSF